MEQDLQHAKEILQATGATCVLCRGETVYRTELRGVAPLLAWFDDAEDTSLCCAADKVVGKAAALLYCLLGVRCVHARVISLPAVKVLRRNGVEVYWDTLTEAIRNRAGTGLCPMEVATAQVDDPEEALPVIRRTLAALQK